MASESKPPFPPFTLETAQKKVKAAQDAWNTKYGFMLAAATAVCTLGVTRG